MFRPTTALFLVFVLGCGGVQTVEFEPAAPVEWRVGDGSQVLGELHASDDDDGDGRHLHRFAVTDLPAGATVRVWLDSDDFDPVLRVSGPSGLVLYNDDFWGGTNSFVQFQVDTPGLHELTVTTYAPAEVGAYALNALVYPVDAPRLTVESDSALVAEIVEEGAGVGAPWLSTGVWFQARAGERLRLRVVSDSFDTTATLLSPSGTTWYNDDAHDTGDDGTEAVTDSTIRAIAPTDGWYQLVVSSYGGQSSGPFEVRATALEPITVADDAETPDGGYAGTNTGGRIFGVFAGITDYGPNDQLPGCADDARDLAAAFQERRLMAQRDAVVLTDKAATRQAFEAAVRRAANRAGPDDVVVLFFSGHGTTQPVDARADRGIELDGTDETIVFADGPMTDNEFAALLDLFRVDTILVAIDACHAGGFARDIMTRPGRIGLFSSDEDVLSSTAESVGAGGYLSHALRRAVLGHADSRPQDGALHVGELTDYLLELGVENHRLMNPPGSIEPLQRLIIERGSFGWTDPLWIYPRRPSGAPLWSDESALE